ncbi:hypothetical protein MAR_015759, partial [Mya arenaria]
MKQALSDLNELLAVKTTEHVLFSITFLFKSEPTIPVAFVMHEKKYQKFHERLLQVIIEKCPNL